MLKLEELGHLIDDLAVQLVMRQPDSPIRAMAEVWVPRLAGVVESARAAGAIEAAESAGSLIALLTATQTPEAGGLSEQLQAGLAQLERAVREAGAPKTAGNPPSIAQDPELLSDFILESGEHLANIETQVLMLERDPCDAEALNAVFRAFHTIKGLAGFLELWNVQKVAHETETVLDRARNGELTLTPPAIDAILLSADYLRRWLRHLEAPAPNGPPIDGEEALLVRIRGLCSASPESGTGDPEPKREREPAPLPEERPEASEPAFGGEPAEGRRGSVGAVKVDTAKLDLLVEMAGEMVIAESLVRQDPELPALRSQRLQRNMAQLTRITQELQKTAMAMRLVPIGPLFRRMARLVRDLSRQFGKRVEMVSAGDEIELDRTIVEELADPLMHMVRNALDHGLETPRERRAAGKKETGRVTLTAQHRGGQVLIEIADDGRGLDRERIAAKAIERKLIASAEGLTDNEIFNLVFEPGFSTAAMVTNVSGRGVGMDVVRRHIDKLRGRIEIRSAPGQGSTFSLKLPLTLAIIDGLVVRVGAERYIVPLFAVREMLRPKDDTIWTVKQRAEMALVRGALLPVLRLYKRFHVTPASTDPRESVLIVGEAEGERFCLLVDELIGKQEVVIKSLGETFKNVAGIAGGAILGDGRVGLILDLDRLFKERGDVGQ
jgi:two-component system chemotaxis sensor kinase CheA